MQKKNCLILVLDFGRYSKKFERILKGLRVRVKVVLPTVSTLELKKAQGIMLTGSKASVYKKNAPAYNRKIFSIKKPVLGVCYGHQLIAHAFGGKVEKMKKKVNAKRKLKITKKSIIFDGLAKEEIVWMSHGDAVTKLPRGFYSTATTRETKNAAMENRKKKIFGVQLHPEFSKTKNGKKMFENFVFKVCKIKEN